MVLTAKQRKFFEDYGYLKYDKKVLTDQELGAIRQRSKDIAQGKASHVPSRFIQLEEKFRESDDGTMNRLDQVPKMSHLSQFDDLFEATSKKPEIVDVIEELLGPNIKLYTEQLMMKP